MKRSSELRVGWKIAGVVPLLKRAFCLAGVILACSAFANLPPLYLTRSSGPGFGVVLAWNASPSANVTGYYVRWGLASGQCTNVLDAGNVTNVTVAGFTGNTVYFFDVVAYDVLGRRAVPSNEVRYSLPGTPGATPPVLEILPGTGGITQQPFSVAFGGGAGVSYAVLATTDFVQWSMVWTTNCTVTGRLVFQDIQSTNYSRRFYRVVQGSTFTSQVPVLAAQ